MFEYLFFLAFVPLILLHVELRTLWLCERESECVVAHCVL